MPFSQSTILDVVPAQVGADLKVSWLTTSPEGTWYQLYVGRVLAWYGTATSAVVPLPPHGQDTLIEVGTCLASEASTNLFASLATPPGGGRTVTLKWQGGSFLGSVDHFNVYSGDSPGAAVDFTEPIGRVVAYDQNIALDGYGLGGYGQGGYGRSSSSYSFTTAPLRVGTWNFAVTAVDAFGNEGTAQTSTGTIAGAPFAVPRNAAGKRLTYREAVGGYGLGGYGLGGYGVGAIAGYGLGGYGQGGYSIGAGSASATITLNWLASTGY